MLENVWTCAISTQNCFVKFQSIYFMISHQTWKTHDGQLAFELPDGSSKRIGGAFAGFAPGPSEVAKGLGMNPGVVAEQIERCWDNAYFSTF